MGKFIRNITSDSSVDKYWTGLTFSSNLEEALEIHSGRSMATELSKANTVMQNDSTISNKRLISCNIFASSQEESDFNKILKSGK